MGNAQIYGYNVDLFQVTIRPFVDRRKTVVRDSRTIIGTYLNPNGDASATVDLSPDIARNDNSYEMRLDAIAPGFRIRFHELGSNTNRYLNQYNSTAIISLVSGKTYEIQAEQDVGYVVYSEASPRPII